jgi:hypothetical protein
MDPNSTCYTIVNDDSLLDSGAAPSIPDLRNALQKGSDEVKMDTMRRVIVGTLKFGTDCDRRNARELITRVFASNRLPS